MRHGIKRNTEFIKPEQARITQLKRILEYSTLEVAKQLLGMEIFTCIKGQITSGIICEVEAYHQDYDKASHSYGGKLTKRNAVMFGPAGHIYVYFIYGMHCCLNITTEDEGVGAAVLIRSIIPSVGLEIMAKRRKCSPSLANFVNGPGKLCQALGISKELNGENLIKSAKIWLKPNQNIPLSQIKSSERIGISKSKELPWRYFF